MTDLAVYEPQTSLTEQMDYARAVSVASMLPDNYRGKPADIMLAVGLGQSMGLSPAESLYRISVIKGKPTASAELVAANVRKAGHRLRITVEPGKATATIVRCDDPAFEFTVVRDTAWAHQMGLSDQPNYRKQGDTMLSWRAITAAARLACPEALYGVAYTPDEMSDGREPRQVTDSPQDAASRMATILHVEQVDSPGSPPGVEATAGEGVPAPPEDHDASDSPAESPLLNTSSALARAMFAGLNDAGVSDKSRLPFVSKVIGREVGSSKEMTEAEARLVLDHLSSLEPGGTQTADPSDPDDVWKEGA